jgi:hypothetical protein
MNDAFKFLEKSRTDEMFRDLAYICAEVTEFRAYIVASGYRFSDTEFDDALRALELKAPDAYEADEVKQLGQWYHMLTMTDVAASCGTCQARWAR